VPLYQFWCDACYTPYEIMMSIADLEEYDEGKEEIPCPECEEPLTKLICPPKWITIN